MHNDVKVRGLLLRGWEAFARERFGVDLVASVREEVPAVPADVEPLGWFPVQWQLCITRHVLAAGCGGEEQRAIDALVEYGIANADRMSLTAAKWLGPARVLGLAPKIHPHLYDVGACESDVGRRVARLRWTGSPLFGDTTWRLLQRAAVAGVMRACGRNGAASSGVGDQSSYELSVKWRR